MEDHMEPVQKAKEENIEVRVFAGHECETTYEQIGDGFLQLVTDLIIPTAQHYIEVFSPTINDLILRSRILKNNRYERRKMTVICWHDQQQTTFTDVAISFLHQEHCDLYWKMICSKIGKNYLEINHNEKLEYPHIGNLQYILNKSKKSYNLVAFHLLNSEPFIQSIWKVFHQCQAQKKPSGINTIVQIFKQILSHIDPTIMMVLFKTENFKHFLQVFQVGYITNDQSSKIDLVTNYNNLGIFRKIVDISDSLHNRIEIAIRARFFKDSLTNQIVTGVQKIVRMTDDVLKQNYLAILNGILSESIIDKIIELQKKTIISPTDDKESTFTHINTFLLEIFNMLWYLQSYKTKKSIIKLLHEPNAFGIFGAILNCGYFKILNVLSILAKEDSAEFFKAFKQNYRLNPQMSVNRLMAKQFAQNPNPDVTLQVINLLEYMIPQVKEYRENYDFLNGTFIVSVFNHSKNYYRILVLASFLMDKLQNHQNNVFNHIIRVDLFRSCLQNPNQDKNKKKFMVIQLAKIIKIKLLTSKKRDKNPQIIQRQSEEQKKVMDYIVSSGIVEYLLKYLSDNWDSNNLTTSGIMEMLLILSLTKYTEATQVALKYLNNQFQLDKKEKANPIKRYIQKMQEEKKQKEKEVNQQENGKAEKPIEYYQQKHNTQMEQQSYEHYLMSEDDIINSKDKDATMNPQSNPLPAVNSRINQQELAQLIQMRNQIRQKKEQQDQQLNFLTPQKRHKPNMKKEEKQETYEIHFDLDEMDEEMDF